MSEPAIDWLLEEDTPGVALLARTRLLGESSGSKRVRVARRRVNDYPPVACMLARLDEPIVARGYKKYEGGYWTLVFLAEMQADGRAPTIRALAERVLAEQLPNGGYAPNGSPSWEIVCLTANLLRSLVHFGYGDDERVRRGYLCLAARIVSNGGVPCKIIDNYTLLDDCKMTLPQTLRTVAAAPNTVSRREMERLRELLVQKLLDIRIYRYVRPETAHFRRKLVPLRPKGVTQAQFTREYRESLPVREAELLPKKGWLRFGFPHSYNSDLLEAMLALTEADAGYDPIMDEALDLIESKRDVNGRWRMESSLNGKMLADVERQGRPSKWLTVQALTVLQHFGRIEI